MSVYNGLQEVEAAVRSILEQDGINFEFIIVNDGSTDGSGMLLNEFAAADSRIRLFHRRNAGLTKALIFGCAQASGDFIARQDSDDISLPGRLKKQYERITSSDAPVMVSSWARYVGPDHEDLGLVQRSVSAEQATHELLHERQGPPAHGGVMFRTTIYRAVGGYRPSFYYGQDADLWLRLCSRGSIAYVPECLYEHKLSPSSISGRHRHVQRRFGELAQDCHTSRLSGSSERPWLEEAERLRVQLLAGQLRAGSHRNSLAEGSYFIGSMLSMRHHPSAKLHLARTIRNNPLHLKAWAKLLKCVIGEFRAAALRLVGAPGRFPKSSR